MKTIPIDVAILYVDLQGNVSLDVNTLNEYCHVQQITDIAFHAHRNLNTIQAEASKYFVANHHSLIEGEQVPITVSAMILTKQGIEQVLIDSVCEISLDFVAVINGRFENLDMLSTEHIQCEFRYTQQDIEQNIQAYLETQTPNRPVELSEVC